MSRNLLTRETPWSVASFTRATPAYGQDGLQVEAGAPRYMLIDPVVIPGATNLVPGAAQDFEGGGWAAQGGAVVTVTQNQAVADWGTLTATRIQTAGGVTALKYALHVVAPSVANQPYTTTLQVKNVGATAVIIDQLLGDGKTIQPGEMTSVGITAIGDGVTQVGLRFSAPTAGNDIDILAWQPMVINGAEVAAFTAVSRGAQMVAGAGGRGVLVEGGVTNLIPTAAQDFDGGGWAAQNGAVVTVAQGQFVPEWVTSAATRIQTAGGTTALKYALNVVAPSVNNQPYTTTLQVKNLGAKDVKVDQILAAGTKSVTIHPGEVVPVEITAAGDGTTYVGIRFSSPAAGDNLDFLAWRPMVAAIERATTWTGGTRAGEMLELLADALPMSGEQGSWEHDLVITPSVYRQSGTPAMLFILWGANSDGYLWLGHNASSAEFRLDSSGGGFGNYFDFADNLIPTGSVRLTVTWDADQICVYAGTTLIASLGQEYIPYLPAAWASGHIGWAGGGTQADCIHQAVRVSSRARTAAEIRAAANKPLSLDADTTGLWFVPSSGEALVVRPNGQTVQFPGAPQHPYQITESLPQQRGRDSDGEAYIYHHGGVRRVKHEPVYRRLSDTDRAALSAFIRDAAQGVRRRCTWVDFDGVQRTPRLLSGNLDFEPENGYYRVTVPLEEELAINWPVSGLGFDAEFGRKTSLAPVWIWKLVVDGTTYWISDHVRTIASFEGGITTLAWVQQWGKIREGLDGGLTEILIADYTLTLLIDPDADPNIETLALSAPLETSTCALYLWAAGLDPSTDPPREVTRGYVFDLAKLDQTAFELTIKDESRRLRQKYIGTKITIADYPNADPDDVGKVIPIVYGTIRGLRTVALKAGLLTTLKGSITAGAVSCQVARVDGIVPGTTVFRVDAEDIKVTAVNGETLTIARGQNGTTASPHEAGSRMLERMNSPFVFGYSDHAVDSIDKVTVLAGEVEIDVTDQCTRYTGQVGNQYSTYGAKGIITISQAQADVILQRVNKITNTLSINNPAHAHSNTATANQVANNVGTDYGGPTSSQASVVPSYPYLGEVVQQTTTMRVHYWGGDLGSKLYINGELVAQGYSSGYYDWAGTTVADVDATHVKGSGLGAYIELTSCSRELTYAPQGAAVAQQSALQGTINSAADALVGGGICADGSRDMTVAEVFDELLGRCGSYGATQINGNLPGSYAINGAITEYRPAAEWAHQLAFELRSRFRLLLGVPRLIVRPDVLVSTATISACRATAEGRHMHRQRKADYEQIINKISVIYARDWSKARSADAYRKITDPAENGPSIENFGEQERPELFQFDFVTTDEMAENVRDHYINRLAVRPWVHEVDNFLDYWDVHFADAVTLAFAGNVVGEVRQAQLSPGSATEMNGVTLVVEVY